MFRSLTPATLAALALLTPAAGAKERPTSPFAAGLAAFEAGRPAKARPLFLKAAGTADQATARRARRYVRWCDAQIRFTSLSPKDSKGYYDLGLYCTVNGFLTLAEKSFQAAAAANPKNADAWYRLGEAAGCAHPGVDGGMGRAFPFFQKAASLYGGRTEAGDAPAAEGDQGRCGVLIEAASRGALRLDAGAPVPWWCAPGAFDCSADTPANPTGWEALYEAWSRGILQQLSASGAGAGVPDAGWAGACGFLPHPGAGMSLMSLMRYYITPGMYRTIRGSETPSTPFVDEWLITDPASIKANLPKPVTEAAQNAAREAAARVGSPLSPSAVPAAGRVWATTNAVDGYVDLMAIERRTGSAAYSFAHIYVWSPANRVVRIWYGADDNARIWVNNRPAYGGRYWTSCAWAEAAEKSQMGIDTPMLRGWNSVLLQVSNVPRASAPNRPDNWGFSMRFTDQQNQTLEGLRWQAERPPMFDPARLAPPPALGASPKPRPAYFQWGAVKDNYTLALPHFTIDDLRALTGYRNLSVAGDLMFDPGAGASEKPSRLLRQGPADQSDNTLNNNLNWSSSPGEMVAMLRYKDARGVRRDLLFLRTEAVEAFARLAKVAPDARARGIRSHADRVIGYFTVPRPGFQNGRAVLVLDTWLGENPPIDEEDLLGFGS